MLFFANIAKSEVNLWRKAFTNIVQSQTTEVIINAIEPNFTIHVCITTLAIYI